MRTAEELRMPDDDIRRPLYLAIFELCQLMCKHPGGRDAALVMMMLGLAGSEGKHLNVSTIADALGMDRKTVRRNLNAMVELGRAEKYEQEDSWPVYCRTTDPVLQAQASEWVRKAVEIFHRRMGICKCGDGF